jgi:hypothetical protein
MIQTIKVFSQMFGLICMALAVSGAIYVLFVALVILVDINDPKIPFFHITYPIMASINFLFFIALFAIGLAYLKGITKFWYAFIVLIALQFGYDHVIGYLWSHPNEHLSLSVAAATGVTGVGHVVQDQIHFWLWGSLLAIGLHLLPLIRRSIRTP